MVLLMASLLLGNFSRIKRIFVVSGGALMLDLYSFFIRKVKADLTIQKGLS